MKEQIQKLYDSKFSSFTKAKEEVNYIIESALGKTDIKIHSIQSRVKKIDSLLKKIEGLEIDDPKNAFDEIKDGIGLRVICLFVSDIAAIISLIKENFNVINEDNKLTGSEISSFGYLSVHFICKLNKEYKGPRYDDIKKEVFEIQIRTISMDAWANISHYLDYKSEVEIPKELRKDFFALSGLFYVADTHFEMFFRNKKEQSKIAKEDVEKSIDVEINFETIEAYINSRFKKRKTAQADIISDLTQELLAAGYNKISDLEKMLNAAFVKIPEEKRKPTLNRVGIVRNSLRLYDPAYRKIWKEGIK